MNRQFIFIIFFLLCFKYSFCVLPEPCVFINACECVFRNGSIIDLTSLGYQDKPRWKDQKVTGKAENFTYSYNPCFSFTMGSTGACAKGVAVCQRSTNNQYEDCGAQENIQFVYISKKPTIWYSAPIGNRTTYVSLVCSENAIEPNLIVQGEGQTDVYKMTLTSVCACPDMCRASHLSAGSVLVIIFMIFVVLYVFLGIVHSSLTRGAHGWELIPHYEFWSDFPLLVRDGCVFVVSGCKPETAYERI